MTSSPRHSGGKRVHSHPARSLGSTEEAGARSWNNDQRGPGFPGTARRARERGRHREGCVKFKHLSYLIKKNADSTSSALQIQLLQKRRLWKTQSPLARVFAALQIPSAAKARHTWDGSTTASTASHCSPPSSKAPGDVFCGPESRIRKQLFWEEKAANSFGK